MDRWNEVKKLIEKYISENEAKKDLLENMEYDSNEELGFHGLCGWIQYHNLVLSIEDKKMIDKIGEELWAYLGGKMMETKYWKDLVN